MFSIFSLILIVTEIVKNISDIGALQWVTGAVVSPQSYESVFSLAPQNWKVLRTLPHFQIIQYVLDSISKKFNLERIRSKYSPSSFKGTN
jgi:hypothetical protein